MEVATRALVPLLLLAGCVDPPVGRHRDPPTRTWDLGGVIVSVGSVRLSIHPHWYAYTNLVEYETWPKTGMRGESESSLCLDVVATDDRNHALTLNEVVLESEKGEPLRSAGDAKELVLSRVSISKTFAFSIDARKIYLGKYRRVRIRGVLDGQVIDPVVEMADWSGGPR